MNQIDGAVEQRFNAEVGRLIQLRRKDRGFSQTTLAAEIGVHRNTLMRWEDGEASLPLFMILRIAYTLRVTHLALLPGRDMVWGTDLIRAARERDPLDGAQWERDPQLAPTAAC